MSRAADRSARRAPALTYAVGVCALLVSLLPEGVARVLELSRTALENGELWRIYTGHLVHASPAHLGWDLLAFVVLAHGCEQRDQARTATTLIAAASVVSIGVLLFDPLLATYRGLSGLDTALFALLVTLHWRRIGGSGLSRPALAVACALLIAKLTFELTTGASAFVAGTGFVTVPLAHVLGACCGLLGGLAPTPRSRSRSSSKPRSTLQPQR